MDSKFSIGDIVEYEGKIYKVNNVYFLNPQIKSDPYVCRLVKVDDSREYIYKGLIVREGLLKKLNQQTVKVLYENTGSESRGLRINK